MQIDRPTERLYLHRMEVIDHVLTKLPGDLDQAGIGYRFSVIQRDERSAWIRGWSTGPSGGAGCGDIEDSNWQTRPIGRIYAPEGFIVGKRAIVDCPDSHLRLSPAELTSVKTFIEGVGSSEDTGELIEKIQGFSFIGELMRTAMHPDGRIFHETYQFPAGLSRNA